MKNGQGYAADNLRKIYQESKTFLMHLQILINIGEDLKQYNGPLSPRRVSYLDILWCSQ